MADPETFLAKLNKNLDTLLERAAHYGSNVPVPLLNQIDDHKEAIALTKQMIQGKLSRSDWQEALEPLLAAIGSRSDDAASSVTIGDIGGDIQGSIIAGRDVIIQQFMTEKAKDEPAAEKKAKGEMRSDRSGKSKLLDIYERRLKKLKEQSAYFGPYAPPHILLQIDEVEAEIEKLKRELQE